MSLAGGIALDGVLLESLADTLVVTDVTEEPVLAVETAERVGSGGIWVTRLRRERLNVRVTFRVRDVRRLRRAGTLGLAAAWAQGRVMTWDSRPGQRLRVRCTAWPETGSLRWNESLCAVFTACEQPWWESASPVTLALAHAGGATAGTLEIPGQTETEIAAEITAGAGGLNAVSVTAADRTLAFAGLGMAAGETLTLGPDGEGRWSWRISGAGGTRSAFPCRTLGSADRLCALPGARSVTVTGDACAVTLAVRGRYL